MNENSNERIVVVGGGAGGLELVIKLARKFRNNNAVDITLVDCNPTHIWKPLLHEIATGSLNSNHDETSYLMLARKYRFSFVLGRVDQIDVENKLLHLEAINDRDGHAVVAERSVNYSKVVLSVGSLCNDFGTPGVEEHCLLLDTRAQAERFHQNFINELHRIKASNNSRARVSTPSTPDAGTGIDDRNSKPDRVSVVIVGAGATGVELAADLHNVANRLPEYGFGEFSTDALRVLIVEAAPRILAQLPERISKSVTKELLNIGVQIRTDTMVSGIDADAVATKSGERINADLVVWAAGIKAPSFIAQSGLPCDRLGRVEVNTLLHVEANESVFAIGDCCACPMEDGSMVPPRAQSAHQMASVAYKNIVASINGTTLKPFVYKDFGSLISLSEFSTVGNLMGNLMKGSVFIEGWLARVFYLSLYRMHQSTVHGFGSMLLIILGDTIYKATRAKIKLH